MASSILLKRSNTAGNDAYTGPLGEVTIDTQARKLRIHDGVQLGGHIVANMADIQAVIDQVDGLTITSIAGLDSALQTITDDIADHEDRLSSVEASYINKDGSVSFTGNVNAGGNKITNVATPTATSDAASKGYVDSEIAALGEVFSYEGSFDAGTQASPFDLSTLSNISAGSYWTADTAGWVISGTRTEYVNVNDAILFKSSGEFKIIDNTNSEVQGTTDFIKVSGSTDTGFVIDADPALKGRITSLETDKVDVVDPQMEGSGYLNGTLHIESLAPIASGSSTTNVFSIGDPNNDPLFSVKQNGDTVIGGVLTVNGTGESTFAGDVTIGGSLTVDKDATVNADFTGEDMTLTGNLTVKGDTILGDEPSDTIDIHGITTIDGKTTVKSQVTKAAGNSTTNAFQILDSADDPLFEVKTNGDTTIAGVLTVNGEGDSYFAGNVNIGGSINVQEGATVEADFAGEDLILTGNLEVHGDTMLGDEESDIVNIVGTATTNTQEINDNSSKIATSLYVFNMLQNGTYTISPNAIIDGGTF